MATAFRALNEIMVMPLGVHGVPGQPPPWQEGAGCEPAAEVLQQRLAVYKQRQNLEKGARAQCAETLDLNAFLDTCK